MKKFLNAAERFVPEMIEGILAAHPGKLTSVAGDLHCLVKGGPKTPNKVGIASGGGSGHLPLFLGYIGDGLLDGCSIGDVFQSPTSEQMLEVTRAIDAGAGVLYIYGNYGGDVLNFDMATEMASMEDITVETVLGADDVASAPKTELHKRRGVAGIFYLFKCAGAAAAELAPLAEVKRVAEKAAANVRTMGVALTPCIVPQVGKPGFELGDDEMEIGMGIHGERGIRRGSLVTADKIVDEMLPAILRDLPYEPGDQVSVLVNGLGATPKEELYILFRRVAQQLKSHDITIFNTYVGEFATSMEMAGASISLLKLDDELRRLVSRPADTPFFSQLQL